MTLVFLILFSEQITQNEMRNSATLIKLIKLSQLCHERNIYFIDHSKKLKRIILIKVNFI